MCNFSKTVRALTNKSKFLLFSCVVLALSCNKQTASNQKDTDKKRDYNNLRFEPLSTSVVDSFFSHSKSDHVLVEPEYYVWGLSVIEWEGAYHAYYSRWEKKHGHKGWMTNCEIAHAVASSPEGPFEFINVVLDEQKTSGWDVNNSHNPYAIVAEGKICL